MNVKQWCLNEVKARGRSGAIGEDYNRLPAWADGGYPLIYLDRENNALCANCATKDVLDYLEYRADWIKTDGDPRFAPDWPIVAYDAHMEGPPEYCDQCSTAILSAYGDPDESEEVCEACGATFKEWSDPHTDADCIERLDYLDRENLQRTESNFWWRLLSHVWPYGRGRNWTVNI